MSKLSQYGCQSLDEADIAAVLDVLRSDWLTTGPAVTRFEQAVAVACEASDAVSSSSGTAALMLAYAALGLGRGDRVWVPSVTFAATASAALHLGADVDLVDVDPVTGNIDLDALAARLASEPAPAAIAPVHMAGRPVDMEQLHALVSPHGVKVVEDACHALGAHDGVAPVGAARLSDAVVFSFHPLKTVTTGEGGVTVFRDPDAARRARVLRNHGQERDDDRLAQPDQGFVMDGDGGRTRNPWYVEVQELGWNYRLSDLHAALGASQMRHLERFVARRAELVARYGDALAGHPFVRSPSLAAFGRSAHHLYVVHIDFAAAGTTRAAVMNELRAAGVGSQVHYVPLHLQPIFRERCGTAAGDLPGAERYYETALTLPLHVQMADEDVESAVRALNAALGR